MVTESEQRKTSYDRLRYATLAVIIASIYLFILRSYGTAFVDMFDSPVAIPVTHILVFCAGITFVVFFYLFYTVYAKRSQYVLRIAALGAFIGAGLMLILHLRNLCLIFQWHEVPLLMDLRHLEILFPYVSAVSLVFFFMMFRKTVGQEQYKAMMTPTLAGLIGSCIKLSLIALMTVNYMLAEQGVILPDTHRVIEIFIVPVLILQFIALIFFYSSFYKELKQMKPVDTPYNPIIEE
jgi:hypothetical protein